ncbi:response regulator [Phenylobacterium sp. J367]|uniref:response regulator n=1 Tax=Phenylobacterium sp. J367 TaxID=2898435 RepID=UPI0035B39A13
MTDTAKLEGLRVLVVEDEMMVSMLIEDMLGDLGCTVIGPASRLDEAIELVNRAELDCAVLDVNLGGQPIFPLADLLRAKRAPRSPSRRGMATRVCATWIGARRCCRSRSARATWPACWASSGPRSAEDGGASG